MGTNNLDEYFFCRISTGNSSSPRQQLYYSNCSRSCFSSLSCTSLCVSYHKVPFEGDAEKKANAVETSALGEWAKPNWQFGVRTTALPQCAPQTQVREHAAFERRDLLHLPGPRVRLPTGVQSCVPFVVHQDVDSQEQLLPQLQNQHRSSQGENTRFLTLLPSSLEWFSTIVFLFKFPNKICLIKMFKIVFFDWKYWKMIIHIYSMTNDFDKKKI